MTRNASAKKQKIQYCEPVSSGTWRSASIEKVSPPAASWESTAVAIAAASISSDPTSVKTIILIVALILSPVPQPPIRK